MNLMRLAITIMILLFAMSAHAEYYQSTAGEIGCSCVADSSPFNPIESGTVCRMQLIGDGGADDGEYWTGSVWSISQTYLVAGTELTHQENGLWTDSVTPSSDMTGLWIHCDTSDSSGIPYSLYSTVYAGVRITDGGVTTIVTASDNASAWNIKLDGTSYITTTGDYVGYYLNCQNTKREVIETITGASDYIAIERGFPFLTAPVSETCEITRY
jgi:hypothetical protein